MSYLYKKKGKLLIRLAAATRGQRSYYKKRYVILLFYFLNKNPFHNGILTNSKIKINWKDKIYKTIHHIIYFVLNLKLRIKKKFKIFPIPMFCKFLIKSYQMITSICIETTEKIFFVHLEQKNGAILYETRFGIFIKKNVVHYRWSLIWLLHALKIDENSLKIYKFMQKLMCFWFNQNLKKLSCWWKHKKNCTILDDKQRITMSVIYNECKKGS